jgi:Domain of unknown function (DUF1841)
MPIFHQQSRADLRRLYVESWRKHRSGQPLEPLERQVVAVIADHPEYQPLLETGEAVLATEFPPELGAMNPFLHMGLHLAIRDQVSTDRPPGIAALQGELARRLGSALAAEHAMLEVLGEVIWQAQSAGTAPPDMDDYLERLRSMVARAGMRHPGTAHH